MHVKKAFQEEKESMSHDIGSFCEISWHLRMYHTCFEEHSQQDYSDVVAVVVVAAVDDDIVAGGFVAADTLAWH